MAGNSPTSSDRQARMMTLFDARWDGSITPAEDRELTDLLKDPELEKDYRALEALARTSAEGESAKGDFYERLHASLPDHPRRTPAEVGLVEPKKKPVRFWDRPFAWGPALAAASALLGGVAVHFYEAVPRVGSAQPTTCRAESAEANGKPIPLTEAQGNWPAVHVFEDDRVSDRGEFSGRVCVEESPGGCRRYEDAMITVIYRCHRYIPKD